eukprot:3196991-Heterocapsa_arctica.AAC.1
MVNLWYARRSGRVEEWPPAKTGPGQQLAAKRSACTWTQLVIHCNTGPGADASLGTDSWSQP